MNNSGLNRFVSIQPIGHTGMVYDLEVWDKVVAGRLCGFVKTWEHALWEGSNGIFL